jgi:hypothetical protein
MPYDSKRLYLPKGLPTAEVLITTPFHPVYLTPNLIKVANLKLAIIAGVGSDHIDLNAAVDYSIIVAEVSVQCRFCVRPSLPVILLFFFFARFAWKGQEFRITHFTFYLALASGIRNKFDYTAPNTSSCPYFFSFATSYSHTR